MGEKLYDVYVQRLLIIYIYFVYINIGSYIGGSKFFLNFAIIGRAENLL